MGNNILAYQFVFFLYIFCFELIMYSSFLKVLFAIQCLNILKCESRRSIPLLIKGQFLLKAFLHVSIIFEYVTNLIFTKYRNKHHDVVYFTCTYVECLHAQILHFFLLTTNLLINSHKIN